MMAFNGTGIERPAQTRSGVAGTYTLATNPGFRIGRIREDLAQLPGPRQRLSNTIRGNKRTYKGRVEARLYQARVGISSQKQKWE